MLLKYIFYSLKLVKIHFVISILLNHYQAFFIKIVGKKIYIGYRLLSLFKNLLIKTF